MAVYNWMEIYLGAIGLMQNCNMCLYKGCARVEVPVLNKDGKYDDEFAQKLFDSCQAFRDLSESVAAKNHGFDFEHTAARIISQAVTDIGRHEVYIIPANPKADLVCAAPMNGYLRVQIIDACGNCKKDCYGRRRSKKRKTFNENCVKFAVWEAFVKKMRENLR